MIGFLSVFCWWVAAERAGQIRSWRKIDGGVEAAVHVERYGRVLVGDLPNPACLAQTERLAEPEVDLVAADLGAGHAAEPVHHGQITARGYLRLADGIADGAFPGIEPCLQAARVASLGLQGWGHGELHVVGGIVARDGACVLGAERRGPRVDATANVALVAGAVRVHDCLLPDPMALYLASCAEDDRHLAPPT